MKVYNKKNQAAIALKNIAKNNELKGGER